MQIRCLNCHKPFALGKEVVHAALDHITAENLHYFAVNCPHCRRVNRVSKPELLRSAPEWKPAETQEASE